MDRNDFDYFRASIIRGAYFRVMRMNGAWRVELLDYTDMWISAECSSEEIAELLANVTCKSVPGEV